VENRVGDEGKGWETAKILMRFARSNNTTAAHLRRGLRRAREIPGPADTLLREIEIRLMAYESLELALLEAGRLDGSDECACSMLKSQATELNQRISELALERAGYGAFRDDGLSAKRYLATRAASIYSGTNEIHRNLIGRYLLAR
jgi:acyl-CoA dehydrogenase